MAAHRSPPAGHSDQLRWSMQPLGGPGITLLRDTLLVGIRHVHWAFSRQMATPLVFVHTPDTVC